MKKLLISEFRIFGPKQDFSVHSNIIIYKGQEEKLKNVLAKIFTENTNASIYLTMKERLPYNDKRRCNRASQTVQPKRKQPL